MSSIKYRQIQFDFENNVRQDKLTGETFKGLPLTNIEIDTNIANLNKDKMERDGSLEMTGPLQVPGIYPTSADDGVRLYNQNGDLVLTAGKNNSNDVILEGNINVGDQGSLDMNLGGGNITTENIFLNGRVVDQSLQERYGVSNIGDVLEAVSTDSPTPTLNDTVLAGSTEITVDSVFDIYVGDEISGTGGQIPSGTTITAIDNLTLTLSNPLDQDIANGDTVIINSGKTILKFTTILRLINVFGEFGVGEVVEGVDTEFRGTIHKIDGQNMYVTMNDNDAEFSGSEEIRQVVNGEPSESIRGTVTEVINTDTMRVGQNLKVFGMQATNPSDNTDEPSPTPSVTSTQNGIIDTSPTATTNDYYYWAAQFRFDNGKIAPASGPTVKITNNSPDQFDADRFNSLSLARSSTEYGILVYRQVAPVGESPDPSEAELIAVLGPNELGVINSGILYADQGTYLSTEWSGKNAATGAYTSDMGVVYFPLNPPTNSQINSGEVNAKGWVTVQIDRVYDKRVVRLNSQNWHDDDFVEVVHDNTEGLQQAINDNRDLALRNIVLPNGVYYTSRLEIPSDFAVFGNSKRAVIKQIPWNFKYFGDAINPNLRGVVIGSQEPNPSRITFEDLTVDGNMTNQVLWSEEESNFAVSMANGTDITCQNIEVVDTVGSGIYAINSDRLRVFSCQIRDGGLQYAEDPTLSPLYAPSSRFPTVSDTTFENWSSPIDVSVTRIGTVVSNTIRNCGSGLLIYGSGNLLSSPNLIMGPDDEFIPSVDKLDSDYDSVNIDLDPGIDYISPSVLYMRGDEPAYLGSTDQDGQPGTAIELSNDILMLTKLDNVETLSQQGSDFDFTENDASDPIIEVGVNGDTGADGRENGYVQWRIISRNADALPSYSNLKSQWLDTNPVEGEEMIGLVYRIKGTEYAYTGQTDPRLYVDQVEFTEDGSDQYAEFQLADNDDINIFAIGDSIKAYNIVGVSPDINTVELEVTEKNETGIAAFLKAKILSSVTLSSTTVFDTSGQVGEKPYIGIRNTFVIAKGRIT